MAAFSHEVHPLFVEPYFRANIAGAISPLQVEFIQNLKMVKNPENYISENLYIFEEPELKSIKDAVQEILDIYARDVLCIPQSLYVTQSWSLTNTNNMGMHAHSHSNSILSGSLYYCELPSPPSNMVYPARQLPADRPAARAGQAQHLQHSDCPHHAPAE